MRLSQKNGGTYSQGDGFGPGKGARGSGVVGHPNRERVIPAIGGQQVLARALKVEHAPVERPVVRVAEHRAHGIVCNSTRKSIRRTLQFRREGVSPSTHLGQHWPGSLTGCLPGGHGCDPAGCCVGWANGNPFTLLADERALSRAAILCRFFSAFGRYTGHCCTAQWTWPREQLHCVHGSSDQVAPS